jgi:hypothetical protein
MQSFPHDFAIFSKYHFTSPALKLQAHPYTRSPCMENFFFTPRRSKGEVCRPAVNLRPCGISNAKRIGDFPLPLSVWRKNLVATAYRHSYDIKKKEVKKNECGIRHAKQRSYISGSGKSGGA